MTRNAKIQTPAMSVLLVLCAFVVTLMSANTAEARRGGIIVVNTGDDVMKIANVDPEFLVDINGKRPAVGVMYSHFGLFWLDVFRWDPKYVLYIEEGFDEITYDDSLSQDELAMLAGVTELNKPTRYYTPPGAIAILLLVGFAGYRNIEGTQAANRRRELLADSRYSAAYSTFNMQSIGSVGQRFEQAVAELMAAGVPEAEARENLQFLTQIA